MCLLVMNCKVHTLFPSYKTRPVDDSESLHVKLISIYPQSIQLRDETTAAIRTHSTIQSAHISSNDNDNGQRRTNNWKLSPPEFPAPADPKTGSQRGWRGRVNGHGIPSPSSSPLIPCSFHVPDNTFPLMLHIARQEACSLSFSLTKVC